MNCHPGHGILYVAGAISERALNADSKNVMTLVALIIIGAIAA